MRKLVFCALALLVAGLWAGGTASSTARPQYPGEKLDLQSAPPLNFDLMQLVAAVGANASGRGNPPRVGANVRVNDAQQPLPDGLLGRSETTLTRHGQNVLAGWNDAQGFCGPPFGAPCTPQSPPGLSGWAYSTNGGVTWVDGGAPDPFGSVLSRGDPWLDDNGGQTWYYANLAVDPGSADSLGVGVWRGHFSGGSFAWHDVKTFDSPVNATTPGFDFYDKEALVAGKDENKQDAYVSLTNFIGFKASENPACPFDLAQWGFGQIEVWRTHDGGNTWEGPAIPGPEQPDSVASCAFEGTLQQSSAPAIGPNGEVYVVWQVGPTFDAGGNSGAGADIVISKSTDGGATWSTPTTVADINSARANPPIGYNRSRINDHPRIDVATTGKHAGRVYVTYYSSVSPVASTTVSTMQQVLVDIQTYLAYSDDGGASWSAPVEIGGPLPAHPADVGAIKRWWPDVSVGPGGDVHVVWYEERATDLTASATECPISIGGGQFRNGTYSSLVDTWWSYSPKGDGGFSMPIKISDATTNWCTTASNIRPNMGDYIDAEAFGGQKVGTVWADGRNGAPDAFFAVGKG